jgi:hypothetical protein
MPFCLTTKHEGFLIDYRQALLPVPAAEALQMAEKALRRGRWPVSYAPEIARAGLLRLKAESGLPGECWLEFQATPQEDGCRLEQTVFFAPRGLLGFLCWNLLRPVHHQIFTALLRAAR